MSSYFKTTGVFSLLAIFLLIILWMWKAFPQESILYPPTSKISIIHNYHGIQVKDPYQWLEQATNPQVIAWTEAQDRFTRDFFTSLPHLSTLENRLNALFHYDTESFSEVMEGSRRFIWSKTAKQEKTVLFVQDTADSSRKLLLDPHQWEPHTSLDFAVPSRDGAYLAFSKSVGGSECPVIQILQVDTGEVLSDTLKGYKQGWPSANVAWLPGNQGFLYSAHPPKGTVPEGEELYWSRIYYHQLGTQANEDLLIFNDPRHKEAFHSAYLSEDGKQLFIARSWMKNRSEVFLLPTEQFLENPLTPFKQITPDVNSYFSILPIQDRFFILTDFEAPRWRVFVTEADHPEQEHWKEWLPESRDRLLSLRAANGHLYAHYSHQACTLIKAYDLEGRFITDIPLPTLGSASLSGQWSKPDVWISFHSFATPSIRYAWDLPQRQLREDFRSQIPAKSEDFKVDQVWYPSKDGTPISMFLIRSASYQKRTPVPVLLTGYGGFDTSMLPTYSPSFLAFIEASGGIVALPNLRGGGEYGKEWHEAGKRANKQNTFDDFIAAAEWLVRQGYTLPSKIGILGGSNGGLLTGAALTQRPDLFGSVVSEVPLLDMLRYHLFGFANIWSEEYGSSDDPDACAYLLKYSPYHRIQKGTRYPPSLIVAAENDARVDPCHAKKMAARLQAADPVRGPHYFILFQNSGHVGGEGASTRAKQRAMILAFHLHFLMKE